MNFPLRKPSKNPGPVNFSTIMDGVLLPGSFYDRSCIDYIMEKHEQIRIYDGILHINDELRFMQANAYALKEGYSCNRPAP